jgi:hypothetical protein
MKQFFSRAFLSVVSFLTMIAYTGSAICTPVPFTPVKVSEGNTLAAQLASKPLVDPLKAESFRIKTYLMCEFAKDSSFFDRDIDLSLTSDLGELRVHFSDTIDAAPVKKYTAEDKGALRDVEIIPVTFNGAYFYICRVTDNAGRQGMEVFSLEHFDSSLREHFNALTDEFEAGLASSSMDLTPLSEISCVSASDSAVRSAMAFFDALGLKYTALELRRTAADGRIYLSDLGTRAPYGAVFLDPGFTGHALAASLSAEYLKMLDSNILPGDMDAIKKAYHIFASSTSSFSAEEHIEEGLLMVLLSIESSMKRPASNEDGLKLHPGAYSHMVDLRGISMEDCEKARIVEDVRKIFAEVVEHYYGMKWAKASMDQMDEKPDVIVPPHIKEKEYLPGKGDRLIIRKLSNGLLPSALSLENGTIILNENFIKMLYKLKEELILGENGYTGSLSGKLYDNEASMFDESITTPYLGEFYTSLIYSVAFHEIEGHYEIDEDGEFVHRRDEEKAQAERGGKSNYVNVIAIITYLVAFVEGGVRISGQKTIEDFIEENPILFSNFKYSSRVPERHKNIPSIISDFFDNQARFHRTSPEIYPFDALKDLKRVPIPLYTNLTYAELFDHIKENPSNDLYVIADEAGGGDPLEVEKKLDLLQRSGVLIKVEKTKEGKALPLPVYELTKTARQRADAVREELEAVPKFVKEEALEEYFEKLKALTVVTEMPKKGSGEESGREIGGGRRIPRSDGLMTVEEILERGRIFEEGLHLMPSAYNSKLDLSHITMQMCEEEGVIDDIRKIFADIARHEAEEINKTLSGGRKVSADDMPGVGDRFLVARISNGALPTAVSLENGVVVLNEYFVKCLYVLRKDYAMHEEGAHTEMFGDYGKDLYVSKTVWGNKMPALGNPYQSLIYGIGIQQIRGFYDLTGEEPVLKNEPIEECRDLGGIFSYSNYIAVGFYLACMAASVLESSLSDEEQYKWRNIIPKKENSGFFRFLWKNGKYNKSRGGSLETQTFDILNKIDEKAEERFNDGERFYNMKRIPVEDGPLLPVQLPGYGREHDPASAGGSEENLLSWQDVVKVFDHICLQEGYEPITVAELNYFLNTQEGEGDISEKEVSESVAVLLNLGLVERKRAGSPKASSGGVTAFAYSLSEKIDYKDIKLLTGIKQRLESVNEGPANAGLADIRAAVEELVARSDDEKDQREADKKTALFWNKAAALVKKFAEDMEPATVKECASWMPGNDHGEAETLLETLAKSGVLMKTRSGGGETVYEPHRMDERQKKAISDMFRTLSAPVSALDLSRVKETVLRQLSSRRKWEDVFETAPVLLWINDVNNVLLSEGLKQTEEYTTGEMSAFLSALSATYNTPEGDLDALSELLSRKYSLQNEERVILRHRMAFLASHGRKKEQWFFSMRGISAWLDGIRKMILEKRGVYTETEQSVYEKINPSRMDMDKLEIDLFLLSRIGLLDAGDEPCLYTIGTFTNAQKLDELVKTRLNLRLLGMPVSQLHEKKVRDALFNKTWPLALFVLSSLRLAEDNTLKGSELLRNLGSGIDEGARSLFMRILRQMSMIGLVEPFRIPRTTAEFDALEFKCADMSEEEYKALNDVVDSLGLVTEKSFAEAGLPGSRIVKILTENGFLNAFGYTTRKFWVTTAPADMKLETEISKTRPLNNDEKLFAANREKIYRSLRRAYEQVLIDDDTYPMLRRRLALEVFRPNLKGAYYVFSALREAPGSEAEGKKGLLPMLAGSEISALLPELEPAELGVYLDFLTRTGLLQRSGKGYRAVRMYKDMFGSQLERAARLMDDMSASLEKVDVPLFTTRVLEITEPIWAARFISRDLKKAQTRLKEISGEGPASRIVLAFDKSWLPVAQRTALEGIFRTLRQMDNIVLITSDEANALPGMIAKVAGEGAAKVPWKNVITFTGDSTLRDAAFMKLYNNRDAARESFLVGVDESRVGDDRYLRLVEMICMAFDQAFQGRVIKHPRIQVRSLDVTGTDARLDRKVFIYVPEPELIDINEIPSVYKAQNTVLQSA